MKALGWFDVPHSCLALYAPVLACSSRFSFRPLFCQFDLDTSSQVPGFRLVLHSVLREAELGGQNKDRERAHTSSELLPWLAQIRHALKQFRLGRYRDMVMDLWKIVVLDLNEMLDVEWVDRSEVGLEVVVVVERLCRELEYLHSPYFHSAPYVPSQLS